MVREKDNTSTSTPYFQNIARPTTSILLSPAQLKATTSNNPCTFQNLISIVFLSF